MSDQRTLSFCILTAPSLSYVAMCTADGTFLTIDSDGLNCGLEGCTHGKVTQDSTIGYHRKAGDSALSSFTSTPKRVPEYVVWNMLCGNQT